MIVNYTVRDFEIDEQTIIDAMADRAVVRLEELGQRVEEIAKEYAPVGKEQTNARVFQAVKLRNPNEFPGGRRGSKQEARFEKYAQLASLGRGGITRALKAAGGSTRDRGLLQFFRGTRAGGTVSQTPTQLQVKGNTIVGAFQHQPGRLKASIKFVGVRREDDSVIATVRAHAPYAAAVHEGFKHKGGWRTKTGAETKVAGNPFLRNALVHIESDLRDPTAYEG